MSKQNRTPKIKTGLKKEVRKTQQEEILSILHQTEIPVNYKFTDDSIDKEKEKFQLLNGDVTSWKELKAAHFKYKRYIAEKKRVWEKTFPDKLYSEWRRLNGWDKGNYKKHHKPLVFAVYTKKYVYGRLPKEILPTLEELNQYIYPGAGIRFFRHFELVTDETFENIKNFIKDIIRVSENCSDMYHFSVKYAALYGIPFQLSIFRDNDEILGTI